MSPPRSLDEFNTRYVRNSRIEGFGLDVTQVLACPFCAAPEFTRWVIIDMALDDYAVLRAVRTCSECGRSGKWDVVVTDGGVESRFVQVAGPPPEPWYPLMAPSLPVAEPAPTDG